jgi:hypothetical protein
MDKTMKINTRKTLLSLATILISLATAAPQRASACEECQLRKAGTYMGQFTLMGNGTVRSWVKYGSNGRPASLGVTFSETALSGLPQKLPKGMPMWEYVLTLPKEARVTGFDHISLDWNPQGHDPLKLYKAPHFDVHFYLSSQKERKAITFQGADKVRGIKTPDAKYFPAGYITPPGTAVPQMGAHAIDSATPELKGQPFTHTFLYGYHAGQITFIEPMISKAFLDGKPNVFIPVKQPAAYLKRGYYPTSYRMAFDPVRREYTISLDGLTLRQGTNSVATRYTTR